MSAFREPVAPLLAGSAVAVGWLVHRLNRIEDRWLGSPEDRGRLEREQMGATSRAPMFCDPEHTRVEIFPPERSRA